MISLIWAMDKNNLIGKNNELPWHYPNDLKYFKQRINGHPIILGDNTFESILEYRKGKPFPNSLHYIATIKENVNYDNCVIVPDLVAFLKKKHEEEFFVIGGATIYKLALPYADRLYITHIDKEYEGNVYFPQINYDEWTKIEETVDCELRFAVYERKQ